MKTYRIKPLEWRESNGWHFSRNGWIISHACYDGKHSYTLTVNDGCVYSDIEAVEKAKELAETLHTADLADKLEEYTPE